MKNFSILSLVASAVVQSAHAVAISGPYLPSYCTPNAQGVLQSQCIVKKPDGPYDLYPSSGACNGLKNSDPGVAEQLWMNCRNEYLVQFPIPPDVYPETVIYAPFPMPSIPCGQYPRASYFGLTTDGCSYFEVYLNGNVLPNGTPKFRTYPQITAV